MCADIAVGDHIGIECVHKSEPYVIAKVIELPHESPGIRCPWWGFMEAGLPIMKVQKYQKRAGVGTYSELNKSFLVPVEDVRIKILNARQVQPERASTRNKI